MDIFQKIVSGIELAAETFTQAQAAGLFKLSTAQTGQATLAQGIAAVVVASIQAIDQIVTADKAATATTAAAPATTQPAA